jgi:replication-associated recombination protein RarA
MATEILRMRLYERYRPQSLTEIVGQPPARLLAALAADPYPCCVLLEGPPGVGKSASALALAHELGCEDEFSGLSVIPASELDIDRCRELFDTTLRLRPMFGRGWHVLLIEELDGIASKQVERYLKVALETRLPAKCIVIATSNGAGKIDRALLQRFKLYCYSAGPTFATCVADRLSEIWQAEGGGDDMPLGWREWGWSNGLLERAFSFRVALDAMQDALMGRRHGRIAV